MECLSVSVFRCFRAVIWFDLADYASRSNDDKGMNAIIKGLF